MNVTYLFGAGASANAIPVMQGLPDSMNELAEKLRTYPISDMIRGKKVYDDSEVIPAEIIVEIADAMVDLAKIASNHASIDTYAKKQFLKRRSTTDIKAILMIYLTLRQCQTPTDRRYDTFYANLIQETVANFPANVKIMSWNYDNQFERAYHEFSDRMPIHCIEEKKCPTSKDILSGFHIYNLNGSCGTIVSGVKYIIGEFLNEWNDQLILKICQTYLRLKSRPDSYEPSISFAWESAEFIENVKQAVANTQILVVIGYSIPYFNRLIDKKILGGMTLLQKVYIQSPEAETVKQRLNAVISQPVIKVELVTETKQFLLPNEL